MPYGAVGICNCILFILLSSRVYIPFEKSLLSLLKITKEPFAYTEACYCIAILYIYLDIGYLH